MEETTFVTQLLKCKGMHEALLLALVSDPHAADDLYQQAAVIMTRKRAELPEDLPFAAWSRAVLVNVVRDFRKMKARQRVQMLDDIALESVAQAFANIEDEVLAERRDALRACLAQLQPDHRQLLHDRYEAERSIEELAQTLDRSRGAVEMLLHRLRKTLAECIERRLRQAEAAP